MALFFADIDPNSTDVDVAGTRVHVDIAIPSLRLVVEVDGYRWHKSHANRNRDLWRNATLAREGWQVLRVREAPLAPLTDLDVVVARPTIKRGADAVLRQIVERFRVHPVGLEAYLQERLPRAPRRAA